MALKGHAGLRRAWVADHEPLRAPAHAGRLNRRALTSLFDAAAASLSGSATLWVWSQVLDREVRWWHMASIAILALLWTAGLAGSRTLRSRLRNSVLEDLPSVLKHVLLGSAAVAAGAVLLGRDPDHAGPVISAAIAGSVLLPIGRGLAYASLKGLAGRSARRVLIIGAGKVGTQMALSLTAGVRSGTEVIGFLDKEPLARSERGCVEGWPVLGSSYDLARVVAEYGVDEVVIAFSTAPHKRILEMIWECDRLGVGVSVVPRLYETVTVQSTVENVQGVPLVHLNRARLEGRNAALKRAFDVVGAGVGLLLASPLLLVIALAVKLDSPGPLIFSQKRVGCDGKVFSMYKFRSMRTDAEAQGTWTKKGDPRRTRVGRVLRPLSLDELPQLFNALKGDISLVGPRPEQPAYVDLFERSVYRYAHRHRIKGGITGWAQVSGLRGDTSIEERALFDNHYIENWSFWLDIKIILLTLLKAWFSEPEKG